MPSIMQYIAAKLLEINERGTWVDPKTLSPDDSKAKAKLIQQDEEIFQIARLCNIGWFGTGQSRPKALSVMTGPFMLCLQSYSLTISRAFSGWFERETIGA
jgi:hypothetical protein